jgi:heme-degrading monooxygenase HmoA
MFLEIAHMPIKLGKESEFESAISKLKTRFLQLKGCEDLELRRSVEMPTRYYLLIKWTTLEDHTVGFGESALAKDIGPMLSPYFDGSPVMEHAKAILL